MVLRTIYRPNCDNNVWRRRYKKSIVLFTLYKEADVIDLLMLVD